MKVIKEIVLDYVSLTELTYNLLSEGVIELFYKNNSVSNGYVWLDSEMDNREYIIINNEIIYLDRLNL